MWSDIGSLKNTDKSTNISNKQRSHKFQHTITMSQESLEDKIISVKNDYIKGDEKINEIQRLGSF